MKTIAVAWRYRNREIPSLGWVLTSADASSLSEEGYEVDALCVLPVDEISRLEDIINRILDECEDEDKFGNGFTNTTRIREIIGELK